jgi:hypothetical protein
MVGGAVVHYKRGRTASIIAVTALGGAGVWVGEYIGPFVRGRTTTCGDVNGRRASRRDSSPKKKTETFCIPVVVAVIGGRIFNVENDEKPPALLDDRGDPKLFLH